MKGSDSDSLATNVEKADAAAQQEKPVQVADASIVTRGVPLRRRNSPQLDGVNSAQLGLLPRLPESGRLPRGQGVLQVPSTCTPC